MGELVKGGEVLAVAVSYERVVEDGQRLSFGTAFAIDMPRAEKNRILDELADLAARQAARARKPKVEAEIRKHREVLAQYQEDAARAEANWPVERQRLEDAIAEAGSEEAHKQRIEELNGEIANALNVLQQRRADEFNAGFLEHQRAGRPGEYKPKGHREVNLKRIDADIEKARETAKGALEQLEYDRLQAIEDAKAALAKAEAERKVALGNYDVSIQRYTKAIEVLEEELKEIDDVLKE